MNIIDRRHTKKNDSVGNRQRFIKRYKHRLKRSVDELASNKGITDVLKDRKVGIPSDEISEPSFGFDSNTGTRDQVFPGNKTLKKGDKIYPKDVSGRGSKAGEDGEGLDEYTFTLTKEEFLDLYFADMHLPKFIKEGMKGENKFKWKRSGYSKEGIPPRLDLTKTLKQSLARRIATKSKRFLDDVDLRYKQYVKNPYPVKHATMILLMDVSASMGEREKTLSKKLFLLLYLFLNKAYKSVDVIFVTHTHTAEEVTEQEFFYGLRSGGTKVSSGLELVNQIIEERLDLNHTNVYVAQSSDGDTWLGDEDLTVQYLEQILKKVQYYAYVQIGNERYPDLEDSLYATYAEVEAQNLATAIINRDSDVYPVLKSLFEEDT